MDADIRGKADRDDEDDAYAHDHDAVCKAANAVVPGQNAVACVNGRRVHALKQRKRMKEVEEIFCCQPWMGFIKSARV